MNLPENEIIVLDIAGEYARIACDDQKNREALERIGFVLGKDQMIRPIADVSDRQELVRILINLSAIFSGGRDWSPAEIVDLYREQGVVSTGYRKIVWKNPEQYILIDT